MSYLLSPEGKISVGGKEYVLDGSFRTLKTIQHVFRKDIIDVLVETRSMPFDDMAKLIVIGIEGGGSKAPDIDTVEQEIVEEIGIEDTRFILGAWLAMAVTPKREREARKKALEIAAEAHVKIKEAATRASLKSPVSRGKNTATSA